MNSGAIQKIADACAITAAHCELLAIDEVDHEVAAGFTADLFDVAEVHDCRAVNAEEQLGIEALLERRHSFAKEVRFCSRADANVVLFRADPADVGDGEEKDAAARFKNNASGIGTCLGGLVRVAAVRMAVAGLNLIASALDCCVQAFCGERLKEVVGSVQFEGSQCIVVVGSGQDYARKLDASAHGQFRDDIEAIHSRHADIEEQQLRRGFLNELVNLAGRRRFASNFNIGLSAEKLAELLTGEQFIVSNQGLDSHLRPHNVMFRKTSEIGKADPATC